MKRTHYFPILIGLVVFLFLSACSKAPYRPKVVGEIKSVAQLATMEAKLSKIVLGTKEKAYLGGLLKARNATFLAHSEATVKLGIDLDKLQASDVEITDNQISVHLPPIEVMNFSYPAEKFEPDDYYSSANSRWNDFSYGEQDELFRQSQVAILKSIPYLGITESAEQRTRQLLKGLLRRMGYEEIYIDFRPAASSVSSLSSSTL
ncbi:MAG: DUF4230 domain-containing protein [Bacteroidota bacterium]